MSLKQAKAIVLSLGRLDLDEAEEYGFAVLKAVAVIRREEPSTHSTKPSG